jgi:hypothetical protein
MRSDVMEMDDIGLTQLLIQCVCNTVNVDLGTINMELISGLKKRLGKCRRECE